MVNLGKDRIIALVTSIILAVSVAIGAHIGTIITPFILVSAIIIFIILVYLNKINSRNYPIYIYTITLCLMWQTTMLGQHIIGSDMAGEFYSSNTVFNDGIWHPSLHYGTQSSTSIVVGWLVPHIASIFHIGVVWVYKIVLPLVFSFVTVILYYAYRKQIGDKKAALSCIFFMVIPIASLEVAQIGKMMVAEVFFALFVLLLVIKIKWYWQLLLLLISTILTILSHYTVGFSIIAYLSGILLIRLVLLLVRNWGLIKIRVIPIWIALVVLISSLVCCVIYYSIADEGVIMQVMKKVVPVYSTVVANTIGIDIDNIETDSEVILMADKAVKEANIPDGYIDKLKDQEALVKTAIGFDFSEVSTLGKVFRCIQYLTQLCIIIGGIWLLFNYKKYKFTTEYIAGIIASYILLAMCIFVPQFSIIINVTRFYHIALFFLAPVFIICFDSFKKYKNILPIIIVIYFIFTSGFVYEIMKYNVSDKLDIPYSASFSAKRTGVYATYSQDDVNAVNWIVSNGDKDLMVVSDYNGVLLISAYFGISKIRVDGAWSNLNYEDMPQHCYIFITSWDNETGFYVNSVQGIRCGAGFRQIKKMPKLIYEEVYRSGNSVILKK